MGGGVIGCSIAREVALRGIKTTILERGEPCREASWAAAGALVVRAVGPDIDPLVEFKKASLALFSDHTKELTEDTGIDTGFRESGGIDLLLSERETENIGAFLEWQKSADIQAEPLSSKELHQLEPNLSHDIHHGVIFPTFTQVRTPWYTRALLTSALKHGATIETHTEVLDFIREGDRIVGVETDREEFFAEMTVLAGGPWGPALARLAGHQLPGVPVKGQIVLLFDRSRPVNHIVHHGKTYLTPRDEGHIVVGSTEEWVGFQKQNTVEGVSHLLDRAKLFYPCLERASLEQMWHGFRPLSVDGFPYIGKISGLDGLIASTGHYRSGIILSPITGKVVAELLHGEDPSFGISPFSPDRLKAMESIDLSPRLDLH